MTCPRNNFQNEKSGNFEQFNPSLKIQANVLCFILLLKEMRRGGEKEYEKYVFGIQEREKKKSKFSE